MKLDPDSLGKLLCERLCGEVRVEARPDGMLMVRSSFAFPDGDRFPIRLSEAPGERLRLSDQDHTLMHMGYEHDVDSFMDGPRGMLLDRVLGETGLIWDQGAFYLDTTPERLSESLFAFGQALTRIYDLTLFFRVHSAPTFYDELKLSLLQLVDEGWLHPGYQPPVPNPEAYPVDFMLKGKNGVPLFLYGIPDQDKARLATMMLTHFRRHGVEFESLLVFADQTEIPRSVLARLSDAGGEMVSTLTSQEHLARKLRRRLGLMA